MLRLSFLISLFFFLKPMPFAGCRAEFNYDTCTTQRPMTECNEVRRCVNLKLSMEDCHLITMAEHKRPQVHLSTKAGWGDVPSGLVFDGSKYHLFFQYYPDDVVWGPMHWYHTTSRDLLHWEYEGIALKPYTEGNLRHMNFSGSAFIDNGNVLGLGKDTMVLTYTAHMERTQLPPLEEQAMAVAYKDEGYKTFQYIGTIIPNNNATNVPYTTKTAEVNVAEFESDIRDPKVFYDDHTKAFFSVSANCDRVVFHISTDLKIWVPAGSFGVYDGTPETEILSEHTPQCAFGQQQTWGVMGRVWEAPDVFVFTEDDDGNVLSPPIYVLVVSIGATKSKNPDGPNKGGATMYFTGTFNGTAFIPHRGTLLRQTKWIDWGPDSYAGHVFVNSHNDSPIFVAWMNNHNYAESVPTFPWRSGMTFPRRLGIKNFAAPQSLPRWFITQQFRGISDLICDRQQFYIPPFAFVTPIVLTPRSAGTAAFYIELNFTGNLGEEVGIIFNNSRGNEVKVSYKPQIDIFEIDRFKSGDVRYSPWAELMSYSTAERIILDGNHVSMKIILDTTSVELLADRGEVSMTANFFPHEPISEFQPFVKNGDAKADFLLGRLNGIWPTSEACEIKHDDNPTDAPSGSQKGAAWRSSFLALSSAIFGF